MFVILVIFFSQFGLIYVCLQQMLPSSSWEGDFQNLCNFDFDQPRAKMSYLCVFAANATLIFFFSIWSYLCVFAANATLLIMGR